MTKANLIRGTIVRAELSGSDPLAAVDPAFLLIGVPQKQVDVKTESQNVTDYLDL